MRQSSSRIGVWSLALGLLATQASAQKAPLFRQTFDTSLDGWTTFGKSAKVSITTDANNIKEGKGALQFTYSIAKDDTNVMYMPATEIGLAKMKSIHFWVKTDQSTPLVFALSEANGGRYYAQFTAPKGQWQRVELTPADFTLADGPDDPKDPDNKLDLDQVENIGIVDMGQFIVKNEAVAKAIGITEGEHTLYLDDFVVSDEALPEAAANNNGDVAIDKFNRPQISWMGVGGVQMKQASGKPLDTASLQADYHQGPGKLVGMMRRVPHGLLSGTAHLSFTAASSKPARLLVQIEQANGNKYNVIVQVPEKSEAKEFSLSFADFQASDDSKDKTAKLDLTQVNQIVIIDASGLVDQSDQDNTLYIGKLRAGAAK